ncbi:cytochrome P450 [Planosporangium mesophilum]|uniref:Cytochrome P450 n=1 Tax=Planosporangium mesophilum TaxID=689768 RepID=A0A8J3TDB6_9ACTN|nr:cytochrome P450 [Planosporangium mesophilum]NJC85892.1 cytochrome P450 [Planosporangium mesophilum]GII25060.1 cytochrome P450 [Planosporangium mesophilum]
MRFEDVLSLDPAALRCPFTGYADAREKGVYFSPEANAYVVSRYADVSQVLRDSRTYSSSITTGAPKPPPDSEMAKYIPFLLLSDDPDHARRRSIVNRAFVPAKLAAWEPLVRSLCTQIVDGLSGSEVVEFIDAFAVPLPITVITHVLGVPPADAGRFRSWSDQLAASIGAHNVDPGEVLRIAKEFAAYLGPLLDEARNREQNDILAIIAAAEAAGELPRHDAARFVMELLIAGNITTTHHLSSTLLMLARNPELADRYRGDPDTIPKLVEESLRLEAPIQGFFRLATADGEVGGVKIPAGSRVMVLYGSANRDGATFDDPDTLRPERANVTTHLAFGRGIHACLGAPLARMESRIALETLLSRTTSIELAEPADNVEYLPSFVNRGLRALPLRVTWVRS